MDEAYAYWRGKAAGRMLPSRADIDPIEIIKLLPDVMLVERLDDRRYRYRLIGTENQRAHGINATGRFSTRCCPGRNIARMSSLSTTNASRRGARSIPNACSFPRRGATPSAIPRCCSCRSRPTRPR